MACGGGHPHSQGCGNRRAEESRRGAAVHPSRVSRQSPPPFGFAERSPSPSGRIRVKPVFQLSFTASPEHIDELGHVNNAVWVQWMERVAVSHWDSLADPAHKDAYYWVVVRHEIDYLRSAHDGDRIT